MTKPIVKCAIYTRKSSDEGLEQSFNSLDAQREACEAYIKSQKHEGWQALPTLYDDGGYSGGSMERPALQKLMADIQSGRVNIIIVYKVDRLTRSLADFAKMVELFDQHNVSFVSVTQQFNTTTSMGRLTLNVLLSFAQFEREVTGERIRDKVAASKAKGMWMGGSLPLGYAPKDRTLIPIPEEVEKVRHIFKRYLALKSVRELEVELRQDKILSKIYTSKSGNQIGGKNLARGGLYAMLKNPIYIGQIRHKEKIYPGMHEAIVPEKLWQDVQALLANNRVEHNQQQRTGQSLLAGLVYNQKGERLTPTNTVKGGKRYRYYVLASTTQIKTKEKLRLPAGEFEALVLNKIHDHLKSSKQSNRHELLSGLDSEMMINRRSTMLLIVEKITVYLDQIAIKLKNSDELIMIDYRFSGVGQYAKIISDGQNRIPDIQRQAILKSYLQGIIWRKELLKSSETTINSVAKKYEKSATYISRLVDFSFVSSNVAIKMMKGDISAETNLENVIYNWPLVWSKQRNLL